MRRTTALIVAASVLAALTACSGSPAANSCGARSGSSSSTVTATGTFETAPTVSFPTPLHPTRTERSVLIAGRGPVVQTGQPVILDATILNGADGSVTQKTSYAKGGGTLFTIGDSSIADLDAGLDCATVGSRIAIASPGTSAGSTASVPVVFVVDIVKAFKAKADGEEKLPIAGLPSVVTTADGTPGITVPHTSEPSTFSSALLKEGDGAKITSASVAVVKYTAVNWKTATVSDSTWTSGSAAIMNLGGTDMSDGLKRALIGKHVGSQVLAVIPPSLGATGGTAAATSNTLIYVVDILGTLG